MGLDKGGELLHATVGEKSDGHSADKAGRIPRQLRGKKAA
jgi:hypothetical protein